jgi:hypothetical protein
MAGTTAAERSAMATAYAAQPIDHAKFAPLGAVDLVGANGALPTTLAGFYDAQGRFFVDVNVYAAGTVTGTFSVYVWDEASGKCILFGAQAINTAANCVYRIEIAGRPFFISTAAAVNVSYTLI